MGGFTLLELAVVLALLGAILLTAIPRLSIFEEAAFRSDARKVAALIRQLDDSSASGKSWYRLKFDIGGSSLETEKSLDGEAFAPPEDLPGTVNLGRTTGISGLVQNGSAQAAGPAIVLFEPGAGAEPFSISLEGEGRSCTISYNPYSGKVKII
jgi:prepilin-type N-terminal cleavage/methylation domain-containing protein